MLYACKNSRAVGKVITLITLNHCHRKFCGKIGIFTGSFGYSAPARICGDITHRRESPGKSHSRGLHSRHSCRLFNRLNIPGTGRTQIDREYHLAAVNDVVGEKNRNTESGAIHCKSLINIEILHFPETQDGTHFTGLDHCFKIVGKSFRAGYYSRTRPELAHLSELFPQGHLLQKIVGKFLRFRFRRYAAGNHKDCGCD